MSLTRVQIISRALNLMGKKSITSLPNQADIVTTLDECFDDLLQSTLSEGNWRFAGTIVQLNKNVQGPIGGYYRYSYQLPANYLKLIHLWPQMYDFEIYQGNQLFTNYNDSGQPLFLDYIFLPQVEALPPYFTEYFYYKLAAFVSLSNAQRPDYFQALDDKSNKLLAIAQAADAQNRPQTPLQSMPMLTRRFVSTFAGG